MAEEITTTNFLRQANGAATYGSGTITLRIDQTGVGNFVNTQNVGFAAEEILLLPVFTLGLAFFRNLDPDNYVDIGVKVAATFDPVFRVKPGEIVEGRLVPGVVYYAQANVAAVDLNYAILED